MSWFTAECLYKSVHTGEEPPYEALQERRFFLIEANDDESATAKARDHAASRQHAYKNTYGATVSWILDGVVAVREVSDSILKDGTEIYHAYEPQV